MKSKSTEHNVAEEPSTQLNKRKREHLSISYEQPSIQSFFKSKQPTKNANDTIEIQINKIKEMRKPDGVAGNAPVDSDGCNYLAEQTKDSTLTEEERHEKEKTFRYQTLLSLLISSQTKDTTTGVAMKKLQEHGCTVDHIMNTPIEDIAKLIKPVTYYTKKAQYIHDTTKILQQQYKGDIPKTVEGLVKLPGIGQKMAVLCMNSAWHNPVGVGVDTHVHRISNRLKWSNTKTPEQTRKVLEEKIPKKYWSEINELLVGFGQMTCKLKPKCDSCLLSSEPGICPYFEEMSIEPEAK
ncbi:NTHL1, partial [Acrasis kona]